MSDKATNSAYKVVKVEKTTAPTGMPGDNWYRYVIQKGDLPNSLMECKKTGTLKAVTAHAKDVAKTINLRHVKGGQK